MIGVRPHGKHHTTRELITFLIEQGPPLNQSQRLRLQCLQSFAHLQRRLDGFLKFFKRHPIKRILRRLQLPCREDFFHPFQHPTRVFPKSSHDPHHKIFGCQSNKTKNAVVLIEPSSKQLLRSAKVFKLNTKMFCCFDNSTFQGARLFELESDRPF